MPTHFTRMFERRFPHLMPTVILAVVCATLGLAWVIEPSFAPGGWPGRLIVLAAGTTIVTLIAYLNTTRSQQSVEIARQYIDRLCELEPAQLRDEAAFDALPQREGDRMWREMCQKLRARLAEFGRRADELEMARAGAEVRARRAVSEREQLHDILFGLADPVLAVDQFGDVVLANPSAERLLVPSSENGEHPALEQLDNFEQLLGMLTDARRRRSPTQRSGELTVQDAEGHERWFRIACRSLAQQQASTNGEGSSGHGAVAVLTDITGQKAIQKRNAEFVSSVSHEMKAPLSSIRAYVELLADGEAEDDETREEFLGVINSQADRLQRLVENLLNIARIEAGVVAVNKAPLSLNELLQEATSVMQPQAENKQITLTGDLSPLYLGVLADRDMLLQGAINLISNAVKYTPNGGTVTLKSRLNDQEVVFEVCDTGVGLSPEDCQRVFEKFYRVKKDRDMAPGTGLGLALVKHIVEDVHSGRIEVESEVGQGSTFRVILPGVAQLDA
ncbi:MAG TPA: ATP-binding protein [Pirellulaceae bacterium]|nr:ATP-binding protein [Pirellulaceae bacterium]